MKPDSPKRVTRNDVAKLANVSPSTVSYVINDGPRPVSAEARRRVLAAIVELDYHPSDVARSLRSQKSKMVGLVIPDTANPFFAEVARVVEAACFEEDYTVILCHTGYSVDREMRYAQVLRSKQVDGVIIHAVSANLDPIHFLDRAGIPVVILERSVPGFHCVVPNERYGGYLATRHLIDLGHCRIGCLTYQKDFSSSVERIVGYREALEEQGILSDRSLIVEIESGYDYTAGARAAQKLLALPQPPTAIVAHNDVTAIGSIKAITDAGLRVPEDISVVGYDDIAQSSYTIPELTTITFPKHEMGQVAASLLLQMVCHEEVEARSIIELPVRLNSRASTAHRRADA